MTQASLLIVTVNWNGGTQIVDCVQSFIDADKPVPMQMVVVDNDSTDGSDDAVAARAQGHAVEVVRSGENLGFGRACNLGVAHARTAGATPDFILFLNPDTRLTPDSFTQLFAAPSIQEAGIGIFGVQLTDAGGIAHSCSYFPTALNFWCKNTGVSRLFPRQAWAQHHMSDFDHQSPRDVDQVMGAFLMIRGALFDALGGFDPRFFVYFEEVDLCLRARQAGYRVWFEPRARVFHHGGGTTEGVKGFRLYLSLSSRLRYFAKNRSALSNLSIWALTFGVEPLARMVRPMVRGRFADLAGVVEGYGLILRKGLK